MISILTRIIARKAINVFVGEISGRKFHKIQLKI